MAFNTFNQLRQPEALQVLAQPQSNDALMSAILAQGATQRPINILDGLGKLALLYSSNKLNTRANEGDAQRRQGIANILAPDQPMQSSQPEQTMQQAVIGGFPQEESASVVPVSSRQIAPGERVPFDPDQPAFGQIPPDGGPPIGVDPLNSEQAVLSGAPQQVAQATPPAGNPMAIPDSSAIVSQLDARISKLQQANALSPNAAFKDEIDNLQAQRSDVLRRDENRVKEANQERRFREQQAIRESAEQRQLDKEAAELEQTEQAAIKSQEREKQISGQTITEIDRALGVIDNDKGITIGGVEIPFTDADAAGPAAGFMSNIPFTDANKLSTLLQGIAEKTGFKALLEAKSSSSTGASGFGALSAPELKLLQNAYANLEQTQEKGVLRENLVVVRDLMAKAVGGEVDSAPVGVQQALPEGVTEDDIAHTMQVHNVTREQVLQRLGGN